MNSSTSGAATVRWSFVVVESSLAVEVTVTVQRVAGS